MKRYLKNDVGVTLIEVLIATAIFAIGISAVAVLQFKTVSGNTRGRIITDATTLAEREMERLMEIPYATLTSGSDTSIAPYTVTWTVTEVDLNGVAPVDSKRIELTVTAPQLGGKRDIEVVYFKTTY